MKIIVITILAVVAISSSSFIAYRLYKDDDIVGSIGWATVALINISSLICKLLE